MAHKRNSQLNLLIMLNIFKTKKVNIPEGNKTIVAAQSWVVRWKSTPSRYRDEEQAEFFTEEDAAYEFAKALKAAFKLTKTYCNDISVKENV